MKLIEEFKTFALRGNVVDMAVGIIIGGAFGKIVASLVNDVIMPPLGMLIGSVDFGRLAIALKAPTPDNPGVAIGYGLFLNSIVNFVIIAAAIFLVIKQMNRLAPPPPAAAPTTKECPRCCSTIPLKATRCAHCTADL